MLVLALTTGCVDVSPHRCAVASDCTQVGVSGRCEPTGSCSFPDSTCGQAGFRYHERAGDRAGICVVTAAEPTVLDPIELDASADRTQSSCAGAGARDVFVELDVPSPQLLFIDTPIANGTRPILALREGSCPGGSELACSVASCGPIDYERLLVGVEAGRYCLVIEEATPGGGSVQVRILPSGRFGRPLEGTSGIIPAGAPETSTCDQPPNPITSCGSSAGAPSAAFVLPLCPGGRPISVSVDPIEAPAMLDAVIALRQSTPTGTELVCKNDAVNQGAESIPPSPIPGPDLYWIMVTGTGPQCGPFDFTFNLL